MSPAHRTKPDVCIVPGCSRNANVAGTARGWCVTHYTRWRRFGWCAAECGTLATSTWGWCDEHMPAGVAT